MPPVLIVPVDGTAATEPAVPFAVALAAELGADVHLMRVLDVPTGTIAARSGLLGVAREVGALCDSMENELAALGGQYAGRLRGELTWGVAEGGQVADVIVRRATRAAAALIVMTTRAHGVVGRMVFGSVADQVVRASPVPVVLVPPRATARAARATAIRRLLLPLDGSALGACAVDGVLGLWPPDVSRTALVHVARPGQGEDESAEAARSLDEQAGRLLARGFDVAVVRRTDETPARAILAAAEAEGSDLVALCTRGRGGLRRILVGSVASDVVRQSPVPVLLAVRPPG